MTPDPHHLTAARLTALGPYFAVRTDPPPAAARPLRELSAADGPLAARIAEVGRILRTREPRVAASTAHLGLAARLWSVGLGVAALTGRTPALDAARFTLPPQGPLDLWLSEPAGPEPATADTLAAAVLDAHLTPLAEAVRTVAPVAPGLLAGNTASALVGTARQLTALPVAAVLARQLLSHPALAPTGTLTPPGRPLAFRRTSCCLYYRTPAGGLCGDCVFTRPPARPR
ncbi:(2Fe-2S)-binding protein [Kitasatospora sp. NPDC049285]|uniref:(2Fe-2S)-binding protein n=1 Tax=Kitasatospora sp. NPDC049285 TaxID=3157096 RepID=UPI00341E2836